MLQGGGVEVKAISDWVPRDPKFADKSICSEMQPAGLESVILGNVIEQTGRVEDPFFRLKTTSLQNLNNLVSSVTG